VPVVEQRGAEVERDHAGTEQRLLVDVSVLREERRSRIRRQHAPHDLEVERRLAHAQVIDPAGIDAEGRVVFGATVELADSDTDEKVTYQIVGDDEADLKHGKISVSSPIARALIGKVEGDTAEVHAPAGVREYEILAVHYR